MKEHSRSVLRTLFLVLLATALLPGPRTFAQDAKEAISSDKSRQPLAKESTPSREELEAKFKATLTDATMAGRWCVINNGKLGPVKEDKYTIVSVSRLEGDSWVLRARVQYGKVDIVAPIPIQVKWAGDTPVITVDKMKLGGEGAAYSARVLVYDKSYAGTWSAGDHGGVLDGVITPTPKDNAPKEQ